MTHFSGALERQQRVLFRRFGEDATWADVPETVRIRCKEWDDDYGFVESRTILRVRFVKVRQSEVTQPLADQIITRANGDLLKVIGAPRLNRQAVWVCEVKPVQP